MMANRARRPATCKRWCRRLAWALAVLCATGVHADDVAFFAAAGVKAPAEELIHAFERETGHRVRRLYDTAGAAEQQFLANGRQGVLVTTAARIRGLTATGLGTTGTVADTLAGVAVAPRLQHLPLVTADDFKAVLLQARRVAFSDPARGATVGAHFLVVIEQLQIRDDVLAKSVKARDGIETMTWLTQGVVELGITQVSEIRQMAPDALLGPFPAAFELATRYGIWHADRSSPAVKGLAAVFTSADARLVLERHGLRVPVPSSSP